MMNYNFEDDGRNWIFGGFENIRWIEKDGKMIEVTDQNREEMYKFLKEDIIRGRRGPGTNICVFCGSFAPGWECPYCGAT